MERTASPPRAAVVDELQEVLKRASELLHTLKVDGDAEPTMDADDEVERLRSRLKAAESDFEELSLRLVDTENQRGRLMNLYVATYQLHATLDLEAVTSTIAEITRELLGAERFALLLRTEGDGPAVCEVAMASSDDVADALTNAEGDYRGGDPEIDAALEDGVVRMHRTPGSQALAVVPLTVQGAVVGALVLVKLLDHKPELTADDKDLLDLLAAHAASALLAARVYSTTDRRLKTLESLVQLVR